MGKSTQTLHKGAPNARGHLLGQLQVQGVQLQIYGHSRQQKSWQATDVSDLKCPPCRCRKNKEKKRKGREYNRNTRVLKSAKLSLRAPVSGPALGIAGPAPFYQYLPSVQCARYYTAITENACLHRAFGLEVLTVRSISYFSKDSRRYNGGGRECSGIT